MDTGGCKNKKQKVITLNITILIQLDTKELIILVKRLRVIQINLLTN